MNYGLIIFKTLVFIITVVVCSKLGDVSIFIPIVGWLLGELLLFIIKGKESYLEFYMGIKSSK